MQISVIVNGAEGKMGAIASKTLADDPRFNLVARLGRKDHLFDAIKETHAKVVLDLTSASCVFENSQTIIQAGAHPVIGTSGLTTEQIKKLQQSCREKKLGGIIIPNFSIAAVLMMQFAAKACQYLPEVEIIEAHHQQKLDAPSGTAMKTAEMMAHARVEKRKELSLKELVPGARGGDYCDIPIHSIRLPGFLAQQQVIFGNEGETLQITHNSIDRKSFMPGVTLACEKVTELDSLCYGLEAIL